ncbi:hypothetical protein GTY23_06845 [Streptomyces sp. SID5998]|nr:hypothetical protein [Streptomyces sp. SID5998]
MVGLSAALTLCLVGGSFREPSAGPAVAPPVLPTGGPPPAAPASPYPTDSPGPSAPEKTASTSSNPKTTPAATPPPTPSPTATRHVLPSPPASPSPSQKHRAEPPSPGRPAEPGPPVSSYTLTVGSRGPDVVDLQQRLQGIGLYTGAADGYFDVSLQTALRRYQTARNIPQEDGAYGPLTRVVLTAETG